LKVRLGRLLLILASASGIWAQQYVISTVAGGIDPVTNGAKDLSVMTPAGIAVDRSGNVYFSRPNVVFKLDPLGSISRFAGNSVAGYSGDGGPAMDAQLNFPVTYPELEHDFLDFEPLVGALAVDSAGNVYIADAYNNRVRKVDTKGIITTVAGDGNRGNSGDDGPASAARFWWPQGVGLDSSDNLYIADGNGTLRRVNSDGIITTLTGNNCGPGFQGPGLCAPEQISVDSKGNVFVPDGYCRVRKVSPDGNVITVAGNDTQESRGFAFTCGYSVDGGPATNAAMAWPYSVAVDASGNLYIADTYNSCIRKVDGAGIITTIAGVCGSPGYSGDGGPATAARLAYPKGVTTDAAGNVFIADTENSAIRLLQPIDAVPIIHSVVNGASELAGPIAAGEIVILHGANLGPPILAKSQDSESKEVSATRVLFNGLPASIVYSWSTSVATLVPSSVQADTAEIIVERYQTSTPANVAVISSAPGFFTLDGSGQGQLVALNEDGSLNAVEHPASPGSSITLFLTGEGRATQSEVGININNGTAQILDLNDLSPGVTQIKVRVPNGRPADERCSVVALIGAASTQAGATIVIELK